MGGKGDSKSFSDKSENDKRSRLPVQKTSFVNLQEGGGRGEIGHRRDEVIGVRGRSSIPTELFLV